MNRRPIWRKTMLILLPVLILLGAALSFYWPRVWRCFRLLSDPAFQRAFVEWLDAVGPGGVPLLLAFQVLQIVVAVLPGGLVELASGMVYGPVWGFVISFSGIVAGMALAYRLARRLGESVVRRLVRPDLFERYVKLCSSRRFSALVLFLFFLPGVPKDALIYAVGMSGTGSLRFFLATVLARIPSVIVAVIAGSHVGDGNFKGFAAIYLTFLAVGLLGGLLHRAIMSRLERQV